MSEVETIQVTYYAVVTFGEQVLTARFPDFPKCVVRAPSVDQVDRAGKQAVYGEVDRLFHHGERLPRPTSLEELRNARENRNTFLIKFEIEIPKAMMPCKKAT